MGSSVPLVDELFANFMSLGTIFLLRLGFLFLIFLVSPARVLFVSNSPLLSVFILAYLD